ncbi:hypothetical protein LJC59_10350, partial [Desulfovibrio sp. OttesenSCG-928-A18]|nr:hypothetical protein [Desulfovibrio sp. OttesenSCG-928-A18]
MQHDADQQKQDRRPEARTVFSGQNGEAQIPETDLSEQGQALLEALWAGMDALWEFLRPLVEKLAILQGTLDPFIEAVIKAEEHSPGSDAASDAMSMEERIGQSIHEAMRTLGAKAPAPETVNWMPPGAGTKAGGGSSDSSHGSADAGGADGNEG